MKLRHGLFPTLAFNKPKKIKTNVIRAHYHVDIVRRSHTLKCDICICLQSEIAEEQRDLLLVFRPLSHRSSLTYKWSSRRT